MLVIHLIATLDLGGAEKQLLTVCSEQKALGYRVLVVPFKGSNSLASLFEEVGVEVVDELRGLKTFQQVRLIRNLLVIEKDAIFHVHSPKAQCLASLIKRRKSILVVSRHDAMQFIKSAPRFISNLLWRLVSQRANQIVIISRAIEQKMEKRGEVVDTSKINVCYYGLSNDDLKKIETSDRNIVRKKYSLENKYVIGTVGRFIAEKNHKFLIDVYYQIARDLTNAHLLLVGYGELEKEIRERIANLGISERVTIIGKENSPFDFYRSMDVFVMPSLTEGFGLVLLEAMAAPLPLVVSDVDALPEVLGSECGYIFQTDDASKLKSILLQLDDEVTRAAQQLKSKSRLGKFSSKKMALNMGLIYEKAKQNANYA